MPPTEKRGRVHTSTVTVSVLDPDSSKNTSSLYRQRDDQCFKFEVFKSSGPGGQSRNKVSSGIKCWHLPTGLKQERTGKNQHQNRRDAYSAVINMLDNLISEEAKSNEDLDRATQIGSGMRGDKRRTYRMQDDIVVDHITGKKAKASKVFKGCMNLLWRR